MGVRLHGCRGAANPDRSSDRTVRYTEQPPATNIHQQPVYTHSALSCETGSVHKVCLGAAVRMWCIIGHRSHVVPRQGCVGLIVNQISFCSISYFSTHTDLVPRGRGPVKNIAHGAPHHLLVAVVDVCSLSAPLPAGREPSDEAETFTGPKSEPVTSQEGEGREGGQRLCVTRHRHLLGCRASRVWPSHRQRGPPRHPSRNSPLPIFLICVAFRTFTCRARLVGHTTLVWSGHPDKTSMLLWGHNNNK